MTIRYKCEECGSVLNIKDEKAGTQGRCPKCKAEFLVPSVEAAAAVETTAKGPGGSAPTETTAANAVQTGSTARADNLSDDEIEKILESKDGAAARDDYVVAAGADEDEDEDEDDYEDDYEDDDEEDEDDDDDEDEEEQSQVEDDAPPKGLPGRRRKVAAEDDDETDWDNDDDDRRTREKKKNRRGEYTPPPQPAISASGIAQGLMGRSDKGASHEPRDEKKKASRPFGAGGEHDRDRDDDEGFTLQEKVKYIGTYALPIIIGVGVGFLVFTWWMARWQRGEIPNLGPVSGIVTLDDVPLAGAEVHFHPMQTDPKKPNYKQSSSVGFTDTSGRFTLTYIANVQGAAIGKHRVQIYASDEKGQQIVPSLYNARTTLSADVKEKDNPEFKFELKSSVKDGGSGAGSFNPRGR